MTIKVMKFGDFVEKTPDADSLRKMIGFAAERLMELKVGAMTGRHYRGSVPTQRKTPPADEFETMMIIARWIDIGGCAKHNRTLGTSVG